MNSDSTSREKLYALFADTNEFSDLLTQIVEFTTRTYSQEIAIHIDFGYNLRFTRGRPDSSDAVTINHDDSYTALLYNTSDIPAPERELLIKLISQRINLEFQKIIVPIETTERLLGITFHDVRNTLGSISGIAQLMELDANGNEEILGSIHDISNIIKTFDTSATESMKMLRNQPLMYNTTQFDLSELLETLIKRNKRVYEISNIELEFSVEPAIQCSGDEILIKEIAAELLVNAATALENSGGKMKVFLKKEGSFAEFTIEHDGTPIKSDSREYIFSPFYTTKKKARGLGLFRIARYLNDWGGTIAYKTSDETPVSFVVQLPITQ